jgi:hypothetical protein
MAKLNPAGAGPESKWVTQTYYGSATGFVTWVLLTVFHVTLPAQMTAILPVLLGTICGSAAGWMAKHTPRLEEVADQVARVLDDRFPDYDPGPVHDDPDSQPAQRPGPLPGAYGIPQALAGQGIADTGVLGSPDQAVHDE